MKNEKKFIKEENKLRMENDARLLLLTYKEGYCYAGNTYLGDLIGVGSRRIIKLLKELSDNNYITMEYNHKFQRKIYINKSKYTSINLEEMY